jgi:uncharacterized protein
VIAVDTNVLVYAHRADTPQHHAAKSTLEQMAISGQRWCIPWPCAHEFVSVVTHTRWNAPTPLTVAFDALESWLSHPSCSAIGESSSHLSLLSGLAQRAQLKGAAVHDARIAAICLGASASELWTCDRDFQRFPDLKTRNPLFPALHEPVQRYNTITS